MMRLANTPPALTVGAFRFSHGGLGEGFGHFLWDWCCWLLCFGYCAQRNYRDTVRATSRAHLRRARQKELTPR